MNKVLIDFVEDLNIIKVYKFEITYENFHDDDVVVKKIQKCLLPI